jgi:hypothetical protein
MGMSPVYKKYPFSPFFPTSLFYLIIDQLTTGALDNKKAWGSVIWTRMKCSGGIAAWNAPGVPGKGIFSAAEGLSRFSYQRKWDCPFWAV